MGGECQVGREGVCLASILRLLFSVESGEFKWGPPWAGHHPGSTKLVHVRRGHSWGPEELQKSIGVCCSDEGQGWGAGVEVG